MTPMYVVQKLSEKTESGNIEWREDSNGALRADFNGVLLILADELRSRAGAGVLVLRIRSGAKDTEIVGSAMHASVAPVGRLLRFMGNPKGSGPESLEEREREDLRIELEKLNSLARKQCKLREEPENKEVIRQELFGKLVY